MSTLEQPTSQSLSGDSPDASLGTMLEAHECAAIPQQLETLLSGLIGDALDVDRVQLHDNFFALGGTSLVMISIIARLQSVIGARIDPNPIIDVFFNAGTVSALASCIVELLANTTESETNTKARVAR